MNDGECHAGPVLSQDPGELPEIPAGLHLREVEAGLHDVEKPGTAQCVVVGHYRYVVVTSHLGQPRLLTQVVDNQI